MASPEDLELERWVATFTYAEGEIIWALYFRNDTQIEETHRQTSPPGQLYHKHGTAKNNGIYCRA